MIHLRGFDRYTIQNLQGSDGDLVTYQQDCQPAITTDSQLSRCVLDVISTAGKGECNKNTTDRLTSIRTPHTDKTMPHIDNFGPHNAILTAVHTPQTNQQLSKMATRTCHVTFRK